MAKTLVALYTLVDLFHSMETGRIAVPSFQRGYVWGIDDVRQLFVSINSGYPVGTLIAVEMSSDHFQPYASDLSFFPLVNRKEFHDQKRLWIVDGVQRLASLYNSLLTQNSLFAILYDLRQRQFLMSDQIESGNLLLRMSSLFDSKQLMSLQSRLAGEQDAEQLLKELNAIRDRFYSYSIPMTIVSEVEDFDLVEMFASINTTGQSLSAEDLARARKQGYSKEEDSSNLN